MKAQYLKYNLQFARPAKTSRGVLQQRPVWYLFLEENGRRGIGECAPIAGLSRETPGQVEDLLIQICRNPGSLQGETLKKQIAAIPSVRFAVEVAQKDLAMGGSQLLFPSEFTEGRQNISINGLVWMGDIAFMQRQINEKLQQGFRCIKLKIGSLQFTEELQLLKKIRAEYSAAEITLRLDANGAFTRENAAERLMRLAELDIHSIEQPIMAGQWQQMAAVCADSPVAIALDEELIGIENPAEKKELLDSIAPHYLVLKPSLHGGWAGCDEWIALAEERGIGWWITSYLESSIGLNAIAQWTWKKYKQYPKVSKLPQGLGTGSLFTNNIDSPLKVCSEQLCYDPTRSFTLPQGFQGAAFS